MNIQEEFEKWWIDSGNRHDIPAVLSKKTWNACAELMQAEIDRLNIEIDVQSKWGPMWEIKYKECERQKSEIAKQAKEIEALRGFANEALNYFSISGFVGEKGIEFGLIDRNKNPTPLLKGKYNESSTRHNR